MGSAEVTATLVGAPTVHVRIGRYSPVYLAAAGRPVSRGAMRAPGAMPEQAAVLTSELPDPETGLAASQGNDLCSIEQFSFNKPSSAGFPSPFRLSADRGPVVPYPE